MMKCISVYTKNFAIFSDIYEKVLNTTLQADEEKVIDGVTISESGEMPHHYFEKMRTKPGVVVMKEKDRDILILQRGELFEIFIPSNTTAVH